MSSVLTQEYAESSRVFEVRVNPYSKRHGPRCRPNISEAKFAEVIKLCLNDLGIFDGKYEVSVCGTTGRIKKQPRVLHSNGPRNHSLQVVVQHEGDSDRVFNCYIVREGMQPQALHSLLKVQSLIPEPANESPSVEVSLGKLLKPKPIHGEVIALSNGTPPEQPEVVDVETTLHTVHRGHEEYVAYAKLLAEIDAEIDAGSAKIEALKAQTNEEVRAQAKRHRDRAELVESADGKSLAKNEKKYQKYCGILAGKEVSE